MISKEKLNSLTKYKANLEERLKSPVPEKHKDHPESFKRFLQNELSTVSKVLDEAKLLGNK